MAERVHVKLNKENYELLRNYIGFHLWAFQSKAKNKENLDDVWNDKIKDTTKQKFFKLATVAINVFRNFDEVKILHAKYKRGEL